MYEYAKESHLLFNCQSSIRIEFWDTQYGGVAQLGEHLPCKQGVMGSNPIISTRLLSLKRKVTKETSYINVFVPYFAFETLCVSLVEMMGFEPMTPCLQGRCSPS